MLRQQLHGGPCPRPRPQRAANERHQPMTSLVWEELQQRTHCHPGMAGGGASPAVLLLALEPVAASHALDPVAAAAAATLMVGVPPAPPPPSARSMALHLSTWLALPTWI